MMSKRLGRPPKKNPIRMNLGIAVDQETYNRVWRLADKKNTTMSAMVRPWIINMLDREEDES